MEPTVGTDGLIRFGSIVPVAEHRVVAAGAQLAGRVDRNDLIGRRIDDFYLAQNR